MQKMKLPMSIESRLVRARVARRACMNTVASAMLSMPFVALLATLPAHAQSSASRIAVKSVTTTLVSSGAYKECFSLSTQQKLRYWYRAESVVDFNIQYVAGKETFYPVKKDKAAIGSGNFKPKSAQDYCVVWTNTAKHPVTLSFEYARVAG